MIDYDYWRSVQADLQSREQSNDGWGLNKTRSPFDLEDDDVDSPAHYNAGEIETIDYIVDVLGEFEAAQYCHGNVLKYTGHRLFNKGNPVKDARKAIWYLNKMVELLESCEGVSW